MKRILFSIITVVVCVAAMGSAFAYFTDVETSNSNVLGAGTLDIQISDNDQGFRNTPVSSTFNTPADWAPGQAFETGPVFLKNAGSITIERIYARFSELVESDSTNPDMETAGTYNIADQIILLAYYESNDGGTTYAKEAFDAGNANAYLNYWINHGAGALLTADGSISLRDLIIASNYGSGGKVTALCMFDGANVTTDPPLVPGATAAFKFEFQLLPDTNNTYQGDTATFRVDFVAAQIDTYPDDTLDDYINEDLGD